MANQSKSVILTKFIWLVEDYSKNISVKLLSKYLNINCENIAFRLPWPPIKISDLDKIHMVGRGLLQEHFCKTFVKISVVTQK